MKDTSEWDEYDDYAIYDFKTNMGAAGIGHSLQVGKTGLLKTSLAVMDQKITYVDDSYSNSLSITTSYIRTAVFPLPFRITQSWASQSIGKPGFLSAVSVTFFNKVSMILNQMFTMKILLTVTGIL